ncbi:MAG: collagenase [Deltaproteobacteria bacterium]|jgi:putative protease|nr:collagenase [Deltaproteobacteria bacterium]
MEEKKIGEVIKYFGKVGVAAIRLSEGSLKVGESIHIVGHTTDVTQAIDSMQIENKSVQEAGPGADIGIKIKDRVREHDVVYKVAG